MSASTSNLQIEGACSQFSYLIFMHSSDSEISTAKKKSSFAASLLLSVLTIIHRGSLLFFFKTTGFRV